MGLELTTDRYPPITSHTRYPLRHAARYVFGFKSWTFVYMFSVRPIILQSDFPLRDVMRSKEKVNQERKYEEVNNYMHYLTFSNMTNGLTSA